MAKLDELDAFNQSLAEATVPAGGATIEHLHRRSEVIYYFTAGRGRMRMDGEEVAVGTGDCAEMLEG